MNKKVFLTLIVLSVFISALFLRCGSLGGGISVDIAKGPHEKLSEYRFFKGNMADLQPNEGLLPYELITPLFTDYAHKARFVWMPKGKSAQYHAENSFDFPEGAVLVKNFYYPDDFRTPDGKRKIIETRLLMKRVSGWEAFPYIWNEEQTEAILEPTGGVQQVSWVNENGESTGTNYVIPNKNQCKSCHVYDKTTVPIGPKVRNLNMEFDYPDGKMNQLDKWAAMGYLSGYDPKASQPKVADWDDTASGSLHDRAMAYLDVNCAHCHNPHGPAGVSGLSLLWNESAPVKIGVCKSPVAAGKGSGNRKYSIVPGKPDESILTYRIQITDPGELMPEVGRTLVHTEGVALIREWIAVMTPVGCESNGQGELNADGN